jgi:hypothetical protein
MNASKKVATKVSKTKISKIKPKVPTDQPELLFTHTRSQQSYTQPELLRAQMQQNYTHNGGPGPEPNRHQSR